MNLLAKIEAEINSVVIEQQRKATHDDELSSKKSKLYKLANDYVNLENQLKQLTALTSV